MAQSHTAWVYRADGERYRLEQLTRRSPALTSGQVRVSVRAASLNYRDLIALHNRAGRKVDGRVACSDGAGEIIEVGPDVLDWSVGDRVAGCFFQTWTDGRFELAHHKHDLGGTLDGMLASEAILSSEGLVRVPDYLDWSEAATLPCAAVTAWYALFERGQLRAGESVLVLGTGGVSVFALQFAVAAGARVFAVSSQDEKISKAVGLGAEAGVNYRKQPGWDAEIWRLTQQRGIDHIIETGGPGTLEKSMASVAAGGQIALIGVLTGFGPPTSSLFPLLARNVRLDGIYVGPRDAFQRMLEFMQSHRIHPAIDRRFAMAEAPAAFQYLDSGHHFGKVVVEMP